MAELAKTVDQALKAIGDREGKYLTFILAGEEYGISILKVREIIGIMPITTITRTPGFVKGVINLRGKQGDPAHGFGAEVRDGGDRPTRSGPASSWWRSEVKGAQC